MPQRQAIVCVDDEPLVLHALRDTLRHHLGRRFMIETASNGAEALELIDELDKEQTPTRMVVSDAMMPVMDGYELLTWLHEHKPQVHTVLITGYGDQAKIKRLYDESGLLAAFDKPWDGRVLCQLIEDNLVATEGRA